MNFRLLVCCRSDLSEGDLNTPEQQPCNYGTPAFLKIPDGQYKRTARFPLINFQITNDDKGSSLGRQVIGIYGVTLTKIPIALLDDSASNLQAEISFNFHGF